MADPDHPDDDEADHIPQERVVERQIAAELCGSSAPQANIQDVARAITAKVSSAPRGPLAADSQKSTIGTRTPIAPMFLCSPVGALRTRRHPFRETSER